MIAVHHEFTRAVVDALESACRSRSARIQVLVGPRQVGKTTAASQLLERMSWPHVFASADAPVPPGPEWIETQWRVARALEAQPDQRQLLILDEVSESPRRARAALLAQPASGSA